VIKSIKDTIKPAEGGQPALRGEYIIEESKEALEYQYRSYVEALGQSSSTTTTTAGETLGEAGNTNIHLDLPLPPGTLTENMGIGIVVVCTKADEIDELEKEKDFKEEQFDFIQQVLRSICLRFGGALFFTSQKKPQSLLRLRSYVLHRLFGQLVSSSSTLQGATSSTTATTTGTVTTNARLFPFPYKANVVDRDEVLIPMGWDSWGKIKILRDGFDPSVVGNGWLLDLEKPSRSLSSNNAARPLDSLDTSSSAVDDDHVEYDSQGRKIVSACKLWEDMIGETDDEIPVSLFFSSSTAPPPHTHTTKKNQN
jgi:dynein light intermediate chain 1